MVTPPLYHARSASVPSPESHSRTSRASRLCISLQVVRVLRGGSFEVALPLSKDDAGDEDEDDEDEALARKKVKYSLDGFESEWKFADDD